ncbi:MAG: hypothetical protein ACPF8V_02800 [Luteibaculum sp.]
MWKLGFELSFRIIAIRLCLAVFCLPTADMVCGHFFPPEMDVSVYELVTEIESQNSSEQGENENEAKADWKIYGYNSESLFPISTDLNKPNYLGLKIAAACISNFTPPPELLSCNSIFPLY